jgi:hypothetical protein
MTQTTQQTAALAALLLAAALLPPLAAATLLRGGDTPTQRAADAPAARHAPFCSDAAKPTPAPPRPTPATAPVLACGAVAAAGTP